MPGIRFWGLSHAGGDIIAPPAQTTSAGVFDSTGQMVRHLWSAQQNDPRAANPVAAWDGSLDDGTIAPTGSYTVKLLTSQVTYTWEGVIYNSSPHATHLYNLYYHNGSAPVVDMDISDAGDMFYTTSYDERWGVWKYTTTANPQAMNELFSGWGFRNSQTNIISMATDGVMAYASHMPQAQNFGQVNAVVCSDKSTYNGFTANGDPGTNFQYCAIDATNSPTGSYYITGIAVQKNPKTFLFVARGIKSEIKTFDKTTGALLKTFNGLANPLAMDFADASGHLWVLDGLSFSRTAVKLNVAGDGTLSASGVTISANDALDIAVSPDGSTVLMPIGGSTHQVKAFNASDGSAKTAFGALGVFGTLGGYAGSPTVTQTKFKFESFFGFTAQGPLACIAFQSNGSWWLCDSGNNRMLHFSAGNSPTYIEEIHWLPSFYGNRVCKNDPTRVFVYYLEFLVDYSKGLQDPGAWTLVRNWSDSLTYAQGSDQYQAMRFVGTYSNGRTYAGFIYPSLRTLYELDPSTGIRNTGIVLSNDYSLDDDMNVIFIQQGNPGGGVGRVRRNVLIGFDGSNNPIWAHTLADPSTWDVAFTSQPLPSGFPAIQFGGLNMEPMIFEPLANGVIPFYNPFFGAFNEPVFQRWHLGGLDAVSGAVKFQTHPKQPEQFGLYQEFGLYPDPPHSMHGDLGGGFMAYKKNTADIFTFYRGEGLGGNQFTIWDHWHQSGLYIGRFGVPMPYFGSASYTYPPPAAAVADPPAPATYVSNFKGMPQAAGNAAWGGIAKVNNTYYLYAADEWYHAGLHRWKVEGCDTVLLTDFPVSWNSGSYAGPIVDPTDHLAGIAFDQVSIPNGSGGWTRDFANEGTEGGPGFDNIFITPFTHLTSSLINCDRFSPSLTYHSHIGAETGLTVRTMTRPLVRAGSGDWYLQSSIYLTLTERNARIYYEILDNTGKIIVQFFGDLISSPFPGGYTACVNDPSNQFHVPFVFAGGAVGVDQLDQGKAFFETIRSLRIEGTAAHIKVTYAGVTFTLTSPVDVGANFLTPTTFRLRHDKIHATVDTYSGFGIAKMNFGDLT